MRLFRKWLIKRRLNAARRSVLSAMGVNIAMDDVKINRCLVQSKESIEECLGRLTKY
jgi:hypothetical protein